MNALRFIIKCALRCFECGGSLNSASNVGKGVRTFGKFSRDTLVACLSLEVTHKGLGKDCLPETEVHSFGVSCWLTWASECKRPLGRPFVFFLQESTGKQWEGVPSWRLRSRTKTSQSTGRNSYAHQRSKNANPRIGDYAHFRAIHLFQPTRSIEHAPLEHVQDTSSRLMTWSIHSPWASLIWSAMYIWRHDHLKCTGIFGRHGRDRRREGSARCWFGTQRSAYLGWKQGSS